MKEFKPISSMINLNLAVSDDRPVDEAMQHRLADFWRDHIGIAAPHTCSLLFCSGRLVVFCDSAAWATQIRHQTPSLMRQLNDSGFDISDIDTKVRPTASIRPTAATPGNKMKPISKNSASAIRKLAENVEHRRLKESLVRLSNRSSGKE